MFFLLIVVSLKQDRRGNMLKKIIWISFIVFVIQLQNVSAKEILYQNENGVSFAKEEYEFLSKMFWDGCQDIMTLNQRNLLYLLLEQRQ